jgi:transketolase
MEGVAAEAASLAGHLGLDNLVYLYDDNRITIEGSTDLTYSDNVAQRFESYHWRVHAIDGHDQEAADAALAAARKETERPTLIICRTTLARGAATKEGNPEAHGSPLGEEEIRATKAKLGWPLEPTFHVPAEVRALFAARAEENRRVYDAWRQGFARWEEAHPDLAATLRAHLEKPLPPDLFGELLRAAPRGGQATRVIGGRVLQRAAELAPALAGGSADLEPSTKTYLSASSSVGRGAFAGRNLHFGIREHGMGGILNGMALHGTFLPYGSTFLVFADYMRPSIRLAALSELQVVYVFTHDSVFLGEDGPTHQAVEHLASLRLIPNLCVVRPADAVETAAAWTLALERRRGPTAIVLSRQKVAEVPRDGVDPELALRGGYVLARGAREPADLVLLATGSEVPTAAAAREILQKEGISVRLVSLPSLEVFGSQPEDYRDEVLPPGIPRASLEAALSEPWKRWVGDRGLAIGIDRFGASAPDKVLAEMLGFTPPAVADRVRAWWQARR